MFGHLPPTAGHPWWPVTRAGRLAVRFAGLALAALAFAQALFIARQATSDGGPVDDLGHLLGPLLGVALAVGGAGAVVAASLALRAGERAFSVYVALAYGLAVAVLVVAELTVPH